MLHPTSPRTGARRVLARAIAFTTLIRHITLPRLQSGWGLLLSMGNSQSSQGGAPSDQSDVSKLKRYHTGASSELARQQSPTLRRLSTTATGSAAERRRKRGFTSTGNSRPQSPLGRTESSSSHQGDQRNVSSSAQGSPRATDRESSWVQKGSGKQFSSQGRARSGSIGTLLGSTTTSSRRSTLSQQSGPPTPVTQVPTKRSELTFRRKKSIDLRDVIDSELTSSTAHKGRWQDKEHISITNDSPSSRPGTPTGDHDGAQHRLPTDDQSADEGSLPDHSMLQSSVHGDALGRRLPAAFPSYLKIPTLIPSTYASPTSSAPPSPPIADSKAQVWDDPFMQLASPSVTSQGVPKLGRGGTTAAAILNTEDVVLRPGEASKVSSPLAEDPEREDPIVQESARQSTVYPTTYESEHDPGTQSLEQDTSSQGSQPIKTQQVDDTNDLRANSRTPTPTPGSFGSARAMTPTGHAATTMSAISAEAKATDGATPTMPSFPSPMSASGQRRTSVQLYTGSESGTTTPALPIGLTSAPSSALTPTIPTYSGEGHSPMHSQHASTPLTKETNNLRITLPSTPMADPRRQKEPSQHARGHSLTPTSQRTSTPGSSNVPLLPIVVRWRGGGKEVFVTGTFANEWRSKILLRKSSHTPKGKKAEYSCVLHLAPGTHRLKFIVDDRWRVSRDLPAASDGEGNLTNYIEVAHQGPAHPGPLSAPGEDLPQTADDDEARKRRADEQKNLKHGHGATFDLIEEARRAEALQRGDLLDVFGVDKVRKEETWTQEIPPSIILAQQAEERALQDIENDNAHQRHRRSFSSGSHHHGASDVPVPPALPRQLEKVILNSTPSAAAGTVDDNSVLPGE